MYTLIHAIGRHPEFENVDEVFGYVQKVFRFTEEEHHQLVDAARHSGAILDYYLT